MFIWSFQGVAVSSDQTYKYILSKDKVGDYFCYVEYNDSRVLKSYCIVKCAATQSEEIRNGFKITCI